MLHNLRYFRPTSQQATRGHNQREIARLSLPWTLNDHTSNVSPSLREFAFASLFQAEVSTLVEEQITFQARHGETRLVPVAVTGSQCLVDDQWNPERSRQVSSWSSVHLTLPPSLSALSNQDDRLPFSCWTALQHQIWGLVE
ncbi:hypothetical protein AKJ16_DCAP13873 [Drosera capensis]